MGLLLTSCWPDRDKPTPSPGLAQGMALLSEPLELEGGQLPLSPTNK